jgi:hypothetical protein
VVISAIIVSYTCCIILDLSRLSDGSSHATPGFPLHLESKSLGVYVGDFNADIRLQLSIHESYNTSLVKASKFGYGEISLACTDIPFC